MRKPATERLPVGAPCLRCGPLPLFSPQQALSAVRPSNDSLSDNATDNREVREADPSPRPRIRNGFSSPASKDGGFQARNFWNGLPQTVTSGLAAIYNGIRDHLTILAAQSDPDPSLVRLVRNKGPELIQFQDRRIWIGDIGCHQGLAQRGKLSRFFLIHVMTELRETLNVRSSPHRLLRSS